MTGIGMVVFERNASTREAIRAGSRRAGRGDGARSRGSGSKSEGRVVRVTIRGGQSRGSLLRAMRVVVVVVSGPSLVVRRI